MEEGFEGLHGLQDNRGRIESVRLGKIRSCTALWPSNYMWSEHPIKSETPSDQRNRTKATENAALQLQWSCYTRDHADMMIIWEDDISRGPVSCPVPASASDMLSVTFQAACWLFGTRGGEHEQKKLVLTRNKLHRAAVQTNWMLDHAVEEIWFSFKL